MSAALKPRFAIAVPRHLAEVEREMDQLMGRFFGANGNQESAHWCAPSSLWEEEGHWYVELELPGVKQEDIEVTLEKNSLRIAAERKAPEVERKYWHQERAYGRFERLFTLPETIDPEGIEAELVDGVLRLTLAKKPEAQPRKITVNRPKIA